MPYLLLYHIYVNLSIDNFSKMCYLIYKKGLIQKLALFQISVFISQSTSLNSNSLDLTTFHALEPP